MGKFMFLFGLMLLLISAADFSSACPSASIIHGWSCVSDDECLSWQSCDLWDHICRHKNGYCGVDLKCGNFWEGCDNITHKCSTLEGYCGNDSDCENTEKCDMNTHKCNYKPGLCKNSTDCNLWQNCASGECKPKEGFCDNSSDCMILEGCANNKCAISGITWLIIILSAGAITSAGIYLKYK